MASRDYTFARYSTPLFFKQSRFINRRYIVKVTKIFLPTRKMDFDESFWKDTHFYVSLKIGTPLDSLAWMQEFSNRRYRYTIFVTRCLLSERSFSKKIFLCKSFLVNTSFQSFLSLEANTIFYYSITLLLCFILYTLQRFTPFPLSIARFFSVGKKKHSEFLCARNYVEFIPRIINLFHIYIQNNF